MSEYNCDRCGFSFVVALPPRRCPACEEYPDWFREEEPKKEGLTVICTGCKKGFPTSQLHVRDGRILCAPCLEGETPKVELDGLKDDKGKPRWSLLQWSSIHQVLEVMEFGAKKYAPNNWQKVDDWRERYFDALQRHLTAWWGGERVDPDSGLHHLAHVAWNALTLLFLDDRDKK